MNSLTEQLAVIHSERKTLTTVEGVVFDSDKPGHMLVALRLHFDNSSVEIDCDADDSLTITNCEDSELEDGETVVSLSHDEFWSSALGKPLLWVWSMVNQNGYFDGLQLHFADNVSDPGVQVQIIAVAGELELRKL